MAAPIYQPLLKETLFSIDLVTVKTLFPVSWEIKSSTF